MGLFRTRCGYLVQDRIFWGPSLGTTHLYRGGSKSHFTILFIYSRRLVLARERNIQTEKDIMELITTTVPAKPRFHHHST